MLYVKENAQMKINSQGKSYETLSSITFVVYYCFLIIFTLLILHHITILNLTILSYVQLKTGCIKMYKLFEIIKWASRISLLYNFSIKKSYISFLSVSVDNNEK